MTFSDLGFVAKVAVLSGALSGAIKYGLPMLLADAPAGQNSSTLGLVVALLLAPSALMGGIFWLRRSSIL